MTNRLLTGTALLLSAMGLAACASSNTVRTSANTAIVQVSAAPICRGTGAARVAQKQAAIETLKAGFDRYIIVNAASANNVSLMALPGSYQTSGTINRGFYSGTTTYRPGPIIARGTHDQAFAIRMFRDGEAGSSQAISARQMLGPKWQEMLKVGSIGTCAE